MDVLLVEDEPLLREMLQEDLGDAGLAVVPAATAEDGLRAAAQRGPPAVLVTDVNLGPGMDGLRLASEARRRWPGIVVFVMTGDERNLEAMPLCLRRTCLLKPFSPPWLVAHVRTVLARH